MLLPWRNRVWLQTVSHKVLRLACPLLLAGAFATSAALSGAFIYRIAFGLQAAVYGMALLGRALGHRGVKVWLLDTAWMFCLLHLATAAGFLRFVRGGATATWSKAAAPQRRSRSV